MDQFLSNLLFYCTEKVNPPSRNPQYLADFEELRKLDRQIQDTLGIQFLTQYENAMNDFSRWELLDAFRQGLRFGARFTLEVLDQSSTSAP